jgi:hypothetical protein
MLCRSLTSTAFHALPSALPASAPLELTVVLEDVMYDDSTARPGMSVLCLEG